jgi:hypothetical protein
MPGSPNFRTIGDDSPGRWPEHIGSVPDTDRLVLPQGRLEVLRKGEGCCKRMMPRSVLH